VLGLLLIILDIKFHCDVIVAKIKYQRITIMPRTIHVATRYASRVS
jgi:hypothetical protein